MKNRRRVIAFVAFFLIIVVVSAIYFASGLSAVYDPIKKYTYNGTVKQLVQNITSYASENSDVKFGLEDKVGNSTDSAFYYSVKLKNGADSIVYDLAFEANKLKYGTTILLVGAHDISHKMGGYHLKDDGVKNLVAIFDSQLITNLNKTYHPGIETVNSE